MVRLCAHHVCDDCNGVCICWGPASCSTSFFIAWRYHHFHPSGLLAFVFVSNISYIDTQPKVDSVWQKSKVLYINVSDFKHVSSLTYCLCFYYKVSCYICKLPKKNAFFLTMNECILHLSSLPAMYFILKILKPLVHARKLSRNSFIKKHYFHFTYLTKCTLSCFFLFFTC